MEIAVRETVVDPIVAQLVSVAMVDVALQEVFVAMDQDSKCTKSAFVLNFFSI